MTHEVIYNSFSTFTLSTFFRGKVLTDIMKVDFSAKNVKTVL